MLWAFAVVLLNVARLSIRPTGETVYMSSTPAVAAAFTTIPHDLQPFDTVGEGFLAHLRRLVAEKNLPVDPAAIILPARREVQVSRGVIHYFEWGAPDAPPVVLLHASRWNAHCWDMICLMLSQRWRCIVPDLPGHGDSFHAADADYTDFAVAADMAEMFDAIGLERFALVGLSLGGMTGLAYAQDHVERLCALVVLDATARPNRETTLAMLKTARFPPAPSFAEFARAAVGDRPRDLSKFVFTLSHSVRKRADGMWAYKYDTARLGSYPRAEHDLGRLAERLDAVRCPVLMLRGGESKVVSQNAAEAFVASLPDARLEIIEGAGHMIHLDRPVEVATTVEAFLQAHPA